MPDELIVDLVIDRVKQDDCKNGYVLDGFPRTIPQAEALDKALAALGEKMDYAIDVDVPDENIVNRMGGRRACRMGYHIVYAAPKQENICDVCGKELILRDDDKPETVQKRLNVYHEQTQPLIDYYNNAGILREVDGTVDIDDVFAAIVKILENKMPIKIKSAREIELMTEAGRILEIVHGELAKARIRGCQPLILISGGDHPKLWMHPIFPRL